MEIEIKIKTSEEGGKEIAHEQPTVSATTTQEPSKPNSDEWKILNTARKEFLEFSKNLPFIAGYLGAALVAWYISYIVIKKSLLYGFLFCIIAITLMLWAILLIIVNDKQLTKAVDSDSSKAELLFIRAITLFAMTGFIYGGFYLADPFIEKIQASLSSVNLVSGENPSEKLSPNTHQKPAANPK